MKELLGSLATLLAGVSLSFAQAPKEAPVANGTAPALIMPSPTLHGDSCCPVLDCCDEGGPRCWAGGEYLLWWVKDQPLPVPLIAVNDLGNNPLIGVPGTRVIYGGDDQDMGTFSGVRVNAGAWLNCDRTVGIEGSGFMLEQRSQTFTYASGANGFPPAAFQGIDAATGAPINNVISAPGFPGSATYTATTQLWGAEINGVFNIARNGGLEISLLGGFRHLNLHEKLALQEVSVQLPPAVSFGFDNFQTSNRFYGGQLGGRVGWRSGRLSVDATAKVALGTNDNEVNISGRGDFVVNGTVVASAPGVVYALPGNIGRQTGNQFSVVPEAQLKAGVDVTRNLRATVGYDFLYMNDVYRPGTEINPVINTAGAFPTTTPVRDRTDFWAHGVSFGLEFRY